MLFAGQGRTESAELGLRIASGIALAIVALCLTYWGPLPFLILVTTGALVLSWEWTRLVGGSSFDPSHVLTMCCLAAAGALTFAGMAWAALILLAAAAALHFWLMKAEVWAPVGLLYIGLPLIALVWLRGDGPSGFLAILFLLLVVWSTDIGAFVAGRAIGGPKLAPRISPNKTWSGALGGLFAAVASGAVVALALAKGGVLPIAVLSAGLSVLTQAGDLAESRIKRRFGTKDASQLIPGHGGLLDRVDGLIVASIGAGLVALIRGGAPGEALLIWGS